MPVPVAGCVATNRGCCTAAGAPPYHSLPLAALPLTAGADQQPAPPPIQSQSAAATNCGCRMVVGTLSCQSQPPVVPPQAVTPSRRPALSTVNPWRRPSCHPVRRHRHSLQWRYRRPLWASASRDTTPLPPRLHAGELLGGGGCGGWLSSSARMRGAASYVLCERRNSKATLYYLLSLSRIVPTTSTCNLRYHSGHL